MEEMDSKSTGQQQRFADFLVQRFVDYRQREGWNKSQAEFADWLGVNNSTLSTWMLGRRVPTGNHIHTLAQKLGPEVYDLLGEPRRTPDDPVLQKWIGLFYSIPSGQQESVVDFLGELESEKLVRLLMPD
jgi:transcriptional regulator with XRE-family HTH domain